MPTATFSFSNAAIVPQGKPGAPFAFGGQNIINLGALGTGLRVSPTGTDAAVGYKSAATAGLTLIVDGVVMTPTLTAGLVTSSLTLFTGLADGPHDVAIIANDNSTNVYLIADDSAGSYTLSVTGAAPAISLPTGYSNAARAVIVTELAATTPRILTEGLIEAVTQTYDVLNPSYGGTAYRGGAIHFRGSPAQINIFAGSANSLTAYRVTIDGDPLPAATVGTSPVLYDWVTVGSGLDTAASHDYVIMVDGGAQQLYELMLTGGGGFDATAPTARDLFAVIGDSIAAASLCHVWEGYGAALADDAGFGLVNAGIPGSTVSTTNGNNPMVSRTAAVTQFGSRVKTLFVAGGINDLFAGTPLATVQADLATMLGALKTGCPAATCYVLGLIPSGSATQATVDTWNAALKTTAVAAGWAFIDPTSWTSSLVRGGSFAACYQSDHTHPNPFGHQVLARRIYAAENGAGGVYPAIADVRLGTVYGSGATDRTGTLHVPAAGQVLAGVAVDATVGTVTLPTADQVEGGVTFGPGGATTGTAPTPDEVAAAVWAWGDRSLTG